MLLGHVLKNPANTWNHGLIIRIKTVCDDILDVRSPQELLCLFGKIPAKLGASSRDEISAILSISQDSHDILNIGISNKIASASITERVELRGQKDRDIDNLNLEAIAKGKNPGSPDRFFIPAVVEA